MLAKRLIALLLLLAACAPAPAPVVEEPLVAPIEVFFSDPQRADAVSHRGGPDEALAAIDGARISVDATLHDLNLWSIRDALLDAHARGVQVRLVVESDNLARRPELQALRQGPGNFLRHAFVLTV